MTEPRVLLLDEPLSALDAKVRVQLRDEIRRIQLRLGTTTVFVTHDQEEALAVSDRVAVMVAGRILQVGSPEDLYLRPADAEVAAFVGASSLVPGVVDGGTVEVWGRRLPLIAPAPDGACEVFVRPENIRLVGAGEDGVGCRGTEHVPRQRPSLVADDRGRFARGRAAGADLALTVGERVRVRWRRRGARRAGRGLRGVSAASCRPPRHQGGTADAPPPGDPRAGVTVCPLRRGLDGTRIESLSDRPPLYVCARPQRVAAVAEWASFRDGLGVRDDELVHHDLVREPLPATSTVRRGRRGRQPVQRHRPRQDRRAAPPRE